MALQHYLVFAGVLALFSFQRAGVGIEEAWVRAQPASADSATGYLTLRNAGRVPLVIKGMRCTDVRRVVFHTSPTATTDSLVIAPRGYLAMRPTGTHVVMTGIRPPLSVGSRLACHLVTGAGDVALNVEIRAPEVRRTNP